MEEQYYGGFFICYESTTNSYVVQGNRRFWANMESDVVEKVWKAITKLGVSGTESNEVYEEYIIRMELRDI